MKTYEKIKGLVDELTVESLAPFDHFHALGVKATQDLANILPIKKGDHVLDLGCGIGGPARYFAHHFDAKVTGVDIDADYIDAGRKLTMETGLCERVTLQCADMLVQDFSANYDGVLALHITMNIQERAKLFARVYETMKPSAWFAISEHAKGEGQAYYPLPWARSENTSFLVSIDETRELLQKTGFEIMYFEDMCEAYMRGYARAIKNLNDPIFREALTLAMPDDIEIRMRNTLRNIEQQRTKPFQLICQKV